MLSALLAELTPLCHAERVARLVELGRQATKDPDSAALVDALVAGDRWQRMLAVWTSFGHRDPTRLIALIRDPARDVGRAAVSAAVRVLDDDALDEVLTRARPSHRQALMATLSRKRRTGPVDRYLGPRLEGDAAKVREVIDLLPYASAELVAAHGSRFAELASLQTWARLARRQGAAARDLLLAQLEGKTELDARVRFSAPRTLAILAHDHPDLALTLVPVLLSLGVDPRGGRWTEGLRILARRRPAATFDALLAAQRERGPMVVPGAFAGVCFDRRTEQLGAERIAWLIEHAWPALPDQRAGRRWFLRMSEADQAAVAEAWLEHNESAWGAFITTFVPADGPDADRRREAFECWRFAAEDQHGVIPARSLAWLAADLRHEEARRHLALERVRASQNQWAGYASLLPFAEAREALAELLGHPEGEVRAIAARALLASLRHDRGALAEGLAYVHARRFEQDPVRNAMLGALADLPDGVWAPRGQLDPATLPAVRELLDDAWDAADLSGGTASLAERLVVRLFRYEVEWGVETLQKSLKTRGNLQSYGLLRGLPKPALDAMIPALEQLAQGWFSRERWASLAWLTANLGRDLPRAPGLVALLSEVAHETPFPGYTHAALTILARNDGPAFAQIAAQLVDRDPSAVVFASVANWISTRRQDLLAKVLISPLTGRWATGRTDALPGFTRGFATWGPDSQARYANHLRALIDDHERSIPAALAALRQLARLGFVDHRPLFAYAEDPRQPVRETAVRALGRWEGPEAAPALVTCLGDARARWAIYALRRILRDLEPAEGIELLLSAPRNKVTVAKEIMRLLGDYGERGYQALIKLSHEPMHRDVWIALLRGLWPHLERERTWPVFEAAAAHEDWVVASRLAKVATGALSSVADRRYCALLAKLLAHPELEARVALLADAAHVPLRDESRDLFVALVERIGADTSAERRAALTAALARMRNDTPAPPEAVRGLRALFRAAPKTPLSEPELVAQAVLATRTNPEAIVEHVEALRHVGWRGTPHERVRASVRQGLAGNPMLVVLCLRLCGRMPESELVAMFTRLDANNLLGYDATATAIEVLNTLVYPDRVDQSLRNAESPTLQRLGLAALERAARSAGGWNKQRRRALESYRRAASPLVAGPAQLVVIPDQSS